jgi:large subunit ribosomal protein L31e
LADQQERVYTVPLKDKVKSVPEPKRAGRAVKAVKEFAARHMNAELDDVWIDNPVNEHLWEDSRKNPPTKVRLRMIRFEDGVVEVSLPEE